MPEIIPAAPGWYLVSHIGDEPDYDPIIAWTPAVDLEGEAVLLPYVPNGRGYPPVIADLKSFDRYERNVVYRPNHDPATDAWPLNGDLPCIAPSSPMTPWAPSSTRPPTT
ncbi:hypothetical protein [Streptomyces mirabilis]|uniref:hypothetical protein n=1 Tax=Streptomyces mirabilis TaxID=68239 RepID=UPI0036DACDE8